MARTIRRKNYVPVWVTRDLIDLGGAHFAGHYQLEGKERAKQLRWWHEDKGNDWWHIAPKKSFRKGQEVVHRSQCKTELACFVKNEDYEVMILSRTPYPWWD